MNKKFIIKWCKKCVLPNTRPNLTIQDDNICSICALKEKRKINWKNRYEILKKFTKKIKKQSKTNYDCVVPVSGGKDSFWQIITALKLGLKPLAVTWKPSGRNKLGYKNLNNLINLGVDHIDYTISPKIEKNMMLKALKKYGSIGIPMHLSIFNITYKVAHSFNIPLVIWGENPSAEYGYRTISEVKKNPDYDYFMRHNIIKNTTPKVWKDKFLTEKDLNGFYFFSRREKGVKSIFLGDFIQWDPKKIFREVKKVGFTQDKKAKTGLYNFADIDDDFISIHHYLKWYKFGFTRLFDNLSIEIRKQRTTREEAIKIIQKNKAMRPEKDIRKFCKFTDISVAEFNKIIEKFRNRSFWKQDKKGKWYIKNFISKKYSW